MRPDFSIKSLLDFFTVSAQGRSRCLGRPRADIEAGHSQTYAAAEPASLRFALACSSAAGSESPNCLAKTDPFWSSTSTAFCLAHACESPSLTLSYQGSKVLSCNSCVRELLRVLDSLWRPRWLLLCILWVPRSNWIRGLQVVSMAAENPVWSDEFVREVVWARASDWIWFH